MRAAEHYDALVVGATLPGLLTAALLAHRRARVRVVPVNDVADDPDEPLFGLQSAPIARRVLDELGLRHAVRTRLAGAAAPVALALPDRRLLLEPAPDARLEALKSVFPEAPGEVAGLLDRIRGYGGRLDPLLSGRSDLPAEGMTARVALRRALARLPAHRLEGADLPWSEATPLRALVAALLAIAGRCDEAHDGISPGGARALWHLMHGIDRLPGGRPTLAALTADTLRAYGGRLDEDRPARALEVLQRRVVAVRAEDGRRYAAPVIVFAGDDAALGRLTSAGDDATLGRRAGPPFVAGPVVAAQRARVVLPDPAPPGLPDDPCGWLPAAGLRPVRVRVEAGTVVLCWSGPPPPLEHLLGGDAPGPRAVEPLFLPGPGGADPLRLFRVPVRGPLPGLVRTGPWVVRGLGLEGDFLTAWHAARSAARVARTHRPPGPV